MIGKLGNPLILALGVSWLSAIAQPSDTPQIYGGQVSYVNPNSLEIAVDNNLFQLDAGFRIHGLHGTDRVQQLINLERGMWVQYRISDSKPGFGGAIQELWVQPD